MEGPTVTFEDFPDVQRFGVCAGRFVEVMGGQEVVESATNLDLVEIRDVSSGECRHVPFRTVTLDPLDPS